MIKERSKYGFLMILAVGLAAIFLFMQGKILFGSDVDWIAQHSVFPDYFRKLFYETGEFYPDFSMEIGGGQNIFNFAYYGLLNPFILLSYLFPWIPMDLWIMGLSLVCYVVSVLLFYYWMTMGGKIDEPGVCIGTTLIFMLAAPLLYHSCVQIMFVNYMPFLCMGLIGTDGYFEKGKTGLLCISVMLMVLTSFYFSIGGIGCLCLYALYCYLKREERFTLKGIVGAAFQYSIIIFAGILLSGFYLAPTAAALFSGRTSDGGSEAVDIISLFLPLGEPGRILYGNYGMGLGCISLVAVTAGIFQKKLAEKVLSISLFLVTMFPVVTYMLNGFLYNREKALIPFIPLMCFQTGVWISSLKERTRGIGAAAVLIALYYAVTLQENKEYLFYLFDFALVMISILLYCRWKKNVWIIIIPAVFVLLAAMGKNCEKEKAGLEPSELNLEKRTEISQMMEEVLEKDNSFYRMEYYGDRDENFCNLNRIFQINQNITSIYSSTYNQYYSTFRNDIFDVEKANRNILMESLVENAVFRKMMGIKYIISDVRPVGYQKVELKSEEVNEEPKETDLGVYVDETAAPLAYGTSKLLNIWEYEKLEFPYNQLVFLYYAITGNRNYAIAGNHNYAITENHNYAITGNHNYVIAGNRNYAIAGNHREENLSADTNMVRKPEASFGKLTSLDISEQVEGNPQGEVTIQIPESDEDQIFFVQFRVKNKKNKDVVIDVGTDQNKLSAKKHVYYNDNTVFSYAAAVAAGQKEIVFNFGEGNYEISDSKAYLTPLIPMEIDGDLYQYEFLQEERENTQAGKSSEVLSGNINMETEGYLITSIPYDENFSVEVDGKETAAELVNEGFLGVKLGKGDHKVVIRYYSPGKTVGMCMTLCGLLVIVLFWFINSKVTTQPDN